MPKRNSTNAGRRNQTSRTSSRVKRVLATWSYLPRSKALLRRLLEKQSPKPNPPKKRKRKPLRINIEMAGTGERLGHILVPTVNVGYHTIWKRCVAALRSSYHHKGFIFFQKGHAGPVLKSVKDWPKDEVIVLQHFMPLNSSEKALVEKERKFMYDQRFRTRKQWRQWIQHRMMYEKHRKTKFPIKKQGIYYLAALDEGIKVLAHTPAQIQALTPGVTLSSRSLQTFRERYEKYKRLVGVATGEHIIYIDK